LEKLRTAYRKLDDGAATDPVTGGLTRMELLRRLEAEVLRQRRTGRSSALVMVGLGASESGVAERLDVIKTLADALKAEVRAMDVVGRWEPWTLLALLPETDEAGARCLVERVRRRWDQIMEGRSDRPLPSWTTILLNVASMEELLQRSGSEETRGTGS